MLGNMNEHDAGTIRGLQQMRASDHDRHEVVDRLRTALEDGRLTMDEYLDRMGLAYQAVSYGDLTPLCADLPAAGLPTRSKAVPPAAAPVTRAWQDAFASLPATLKVLWTIWLAAVSVNVVVWALVSGTSGHLAYPWPVWVAGPYGAVLFAVSAITAQIRRGRPLAGRPLLSGRG
jgi:Domain of unknown function (DUF1707)